MRAFGVLSLTLAVAVLLGVIGCNTPERRETGQLWQETRTQVALQLADDHIRNGKFDRARGLLAAQSEKPDERVLIRLARIDLEEGDYETVLARVAQLAPEQRDALNWQELVAVAYEGLGRWSEAAQAYERAYWLDTTGPRLAAWLDALMLADAGERAREVLATERVQFPGDVAVMHAAARLLEQLGDHDAAVRELSAALLQFADSKQIKCELARAFMGAERHVEAIPLWRGLIEATTDGFERQTLRRELGACQLAAALYADAAATYRVLTLTNSSDCAAWSGLATALVAAGRPGEAVTAARSGLRVSPAHADLQLALACAYARLGQYGDAADVLARASSSAGDEPLVREVLTRWREAQAARSE